MWNYSFILPSLLMLCVILIYYFGRPRLPIRLNRAFLGILIWDALTILTDYVSSRADENYTLFSIAAVNALNMAYFVCFLARIFWFFLFTAAAIKFYSGKPGWVPWLFALPFLAAEGIALSSFFTGALFTIDGAGYHRGPLYHTLAVCFFLYILLSVLLILRAGQRLSRFERVSLLGYNGILLAGNILRILLPAYLIMNPFCLLAIMVIFISFQNPDLYLSDRGNVFNVKALHEMLYELGHRRGFRILGISLRDYNDQRGIYGGPQMDQGITLISQYLVSRYPDCRVFYLRGGCFAVLGSETMNHEYMRGEIEARFRLPWKAADADLYLTPAFVLIGEKNNGEAADHIVNTLFIALDSAAKTGDQLDASDMTSAIDAIDEQIRVKRILERALEQNAVEVFFQPIIESASGKIAAAEALARIRDEDGRLIPPNLFIPIAEKNGHINLLGEQVFRKTCAFIHDHARESLNLSWVNVNLSPIQCMRRDLADRFSDILKEYDVPASFIHLEITEQSMIDYSMLLRQVMLLRSKGFVFVLDDYGSGYSNLTRVKHYPFINIKLDMEVVWDFFRERDPLLPTLIQTFKQMNMTITAEGIETREMADALCGIGCDFLQGFYYSKPVPIDEFVRKYGG